MDSNYYSCPGCSHNYRQRTRQKVNPIVDDPKSSNPQSILDWLKHRLQTIQITTQYSQQHLRP